MEEEIFQSTELVITDVDGVWTDGGMYYSSNGVELKKFSIYDGGGVMLLKLAKIPLIILSGENNEILEKRFKKLRISDYRLGIKDKVSELFKIIEEYNVRKENVVYIGDFINDYSAMSEVGIPICPINACDEICKISKLIVKKKGGDGIIWEVAKYILRSKNIYEKTFKLYLERLKKD